MQTQKSFNCYTNITCCVTDFICLFLYKFKRFVVTNNEFSSSAFFKKIKNKNFQVILINKNNFLQFQSFLYKVVIRELIGNSLLLRKQLPIYKNVTFYFFVNKPITTIRKSKDVAFIRLLKFLDYALAYLVRSFVHIISIYSFKNKLLIGLNWAVIFFNYEKSNRLIFQNFKVNYT